MRQEDGRPARSPVQQHIRVRRLQPRQVVEVVRLPKDAEPLRQRRPLHHRDRPVPDLLEYLRAPCLKLLRREIRRHRQRRKHQQQQKRHDTFYHTLTNRLYPGNIIMSGWK